MTSPILGVLERARWAPSGDNTQPWRFEIVDDHQCAVYGFDTRADCVYDLDGHASQMALGGLVETASLAANAGGFSLVSTRRSTLSDEEVVFDWILEPRRSAEPDYDSELAAAIETRCANRRPYSPHALESKDVRALQSAMPSKSELRFIRGWRGKARAALLCFHNAKLRLTIPEAYEVHRRIIAWDSSHSSDKVPDQALGVTPLTLRAMRWALADWRRTKFLNKWFAGTWAPRIEMDLLPGLACGAHALVLAEKPPETANDYVQAGRAMQRLWLAAARRGLQLQPEMTPLIFSRYARERRVFSKEPGAAARALELRDQLSALVGSDSDAARVIFFCRVGYGSFPRARSTRLAVEQLLSSRETTATAHQAKHSIGAR
jgi:nitroreductase